MATGKAETEVTTYRNKGLDIEELVQNATWRELLSELVTSNQLDPWDIDISKVVEGYLAVVKRMKVLELHIPANIMLAASVLLGMKSDVLSVFEPVEEIAESEIQVERIIPEVPALVPRLRLQPGKRVSLSELMDALNEAIKINEKRAEISMERAAPMNFIINEKDIDEKLSYALSLIKNSIDKEGYTTFSDVAKSYESGKVLLDLFIPVLFLAHQGDLSIFQEEFFNEIIIRIGNKNG